MYQTGRRDSLSSDGRWLFLLLSKLLSCLVDLLPVLLWSPYVIGQTIIFSSCNYYLLLLLLFSSPNLSGRKLDVYRTLTHGVALVRI